MPYRESSSRLRRLRRLIVCVASRLRRLVVGASASRLRRLVTSRLRRLVVCGASGHLTLPFYLAMSPVTLGRSSLPLPMSDRQGDRPRDGSSRPA